MALACEHGIEPSYMALGALAGLALLLQDPDAYEVPHELRRSTWQDLDEPHLTALLTWLWQGQISPHAPAFIDHICRATIPLMNLLQR
jgi:hypothetical protein